MKTLILGGARSGKSQFAEGLASASTGVATAAHAAAHRKRVIYLATAEPRDGEMARRVASHRARRPADWALVEEPLALAQTLQSLARDDTCILVDCLTLWLSNLIFAGAAGRQAEAGEAIDCPQLTAATAALIDGLPGLPGEVILVSNEVGCGIVPFSPLSRLFADEQGRLNQRVAAVCERVILVAAGLPLTLKSA